MGAVALGIAASVDYHQWEQRARWVLGGATALLLLLVLPFTDPIVLELNGARRWLSIGNITFQPSELAKWAIVVWSAKMAAKMSRDRARMSRQVQMIMASQKANP